MPSASHALDAPPRRKRAILLDFDGTLYHARDFQNCLHAAFVAFSARRLRIGVADVERRLAQFRAEDPAPGELAFLDDNNIPVADWLDVAETLASEARKVKLDAAVVETLSEARSYFYVALTSNSPWALIEAMLESSAAIVNFDLIACPRARDHRVLFPRRGKPSIALYRSILKTFSVSPGDAVAIGDRHEIDIAPAEACGLRGVLLNPGDRLDELLRYEINRARSSK